MTLSCVVLDVGETLVDETRLWSGWARWLEVPEFTLYGVLGGLAARGEDHRRFVSLLRPGTDFADESAAMQAAGHGWQLGRQDLYPDALPCLRQLAADGWRVAVGGNQSSELQALVDRLGLPVHVVTSSAELGAAKPDPGFFRAVAGRLGVAPEACVSVGDRVDNDVLPALAAGLTAVHLHRGPWGVLHAGSAALDRPGVHRLPALTGLPQLLRGLR